jgi:hypothetical protein
VLDGAAILHSMQRIREGPNLGGEAETLDKPEPPLPKFDICCCVEIIILVRLRTRLLPPFAERRACKGQVGI